MIYENNRLEQITEALYNQQQGNPPPQGNNNPPQGNQQQGNPPPQGNNNQQQQGNNSSDIYLRQKNQLMDKLVQIVRIVARTDKATAKELDDIHETLGVILYS